MHNHVIHWAFFDQFNLKMGGQLWHFHQLLFDLRRKNIDPAQDHHIIAATGNFLHPPHAARRARKEAGQIASTVADPEAQLRQLVRKLLHMYRGADAEHRLQLQSTTALPKAQRHILAEIQRSIVKEFSEAIHAAAPEYLGQAPDHLRPLTMSLFGMVNWFYLWHQPDRGLSREAYAYLATEILLGGLARLQNQAHLP